MIEWTAYHFDHALQIGGRPAIGPLRADDAARLEHLQYRLQAVLVGLPVEAALNLLGGQVALLLVTSCPSLETGKRSGRDFSTMVVEAVRANWNDTYFAALRAQRLDEARRSMN